jgi:hypothetical protein
VSERARVVTFRDAGLHSRVLRGLNHLGGGLARLGPRLPSLAPEALLGAARRRTGLSDFGDGGLREALEVLADSIEREGRLDTFGRIALRGLLVGALSNRLRLLDFARRHPEVREERIERPWVVLGLPRTGTTLLSFLLGLDPEVRPLLQWEASRPLPPPELATRAEDPRIAETARVFAQLHRLNPAVRAMHPMGATLPTECVALFVFALRSLSIETQVFAPSYGRWLEQADMRDAFAMHRLALQVLQLRVPTQAWSLKTPNHLWCLEALREAYPDARLVWTHRDPGKVVPSVASLLTSLQRANSRATDPRVLGAEWDRKLHLAVSRGAAFDERQGGRPWCFHLQYVDLVADPVAAVEKLYAHFGEPVRLLHARRMRAWLRGRPQDAFGRHVYDPAAFGLRRADMDARYASYRERFGVPLED